MRNTRAMRMLGILTAAGTILLSTACGNGGTAAAGPDKTAVADPMASFRACLEKQGAYIPDGGKAPGGAPPTGRPPNRPSDSPTGGPGSPQTGRPSNAPTDNPPTGIRPTRSAAEQKAMQACASLAPHRVTGKNQGPPPTSQPTNN